MESPEMEGDGKRRKVELPMMCFEAPVVVVKAEAKAAAAAQHVSKRQRPEMESPEMEGDGITQGKRRKVLPIMRFEAPVVASAMEAVARAEVATAAARVAAAMTAMAAAAKVTAMVVKAEAKAAAAAQTAPSRGRTDDAVRNRYLRLQRKQEQGEKKGDMWTAEEDRRIREAVLYHGRKWHEIAAGLPGRSANAVRATAARPLRCTPAMHPSPWPGARQPPYQLLHSPLPAATPPLPAAAPPLTRCATATSDAPRRRVRGC